MSAKQLSIYPLMFMSLLVISQLSCEPSVRSEDMEWPPSLSSAVQEAPTVNYCTLAHDPARYAGMIVRTTVNYYYNSENTYVDDQTCNDPHSAAWAVFDDSYRYSDITVAERFHQLLRPSGPSRFGQVRILVVGRLKGPNELGFGHLNDYRYLFEIMRIEQVDPIAIN